MSSLISKSCHLRPTNKCTLPPPQNIFSTPPFSIPQLMEEKMHLNAVKSKLSEKDITLWDKHTHFTNRAGRVVQTLRHQIDAEMCTVAWVKFYEMVEAYDLVPQSATLEGRLNSVHLCEAPGAFICSLNHYLRTNFERMDWDWLAISLNPYFEGNNLSAMIDDDRFISQTTDHWYFGVDNSGNLMNQENIRGLWDTAAGRFDKVLLVTADGSVDCSTSPGEQESMVAALHYAEVLAGLGILAQGGSFVLKLFTLFEHSTIGLLFLFACLFDDLHVCKPSTSKGGNSETYVIAKGFKGWGTIPKDYLSLLLSHVASDLPQQALVALLDIPKDFLEQVIECAILFSRWQIDTIEENLELFDCNFSSRASRRSIEHEKTAIANRFASKFRIRCLDPQHRVVAQDRGLDGSNLHTSLGGGSGGVRRVRPSGSFQERVAEKRNRDALMEGATESIFQHPHPQAETEAQAQTEADREDRTEGHPCKRAKTDGSIGETSSKEVAGLMDRMDPKQDGITESIQLQQLPLRSGLGLASHASDESIIHWFNHEHSPSLPWKLDNQIVVGPVIKKLHISKFCSWIAMLKLQEARSGCSADMIDRYASSAPLPSPFLSREAVELADLNLLLQIVPQRPQLTFRFIDLSGGPGGYADYILRTVGESVVGLSCRASDMKEYDPKLTTCTVPSFYIQSLRSSATHLDFPEELSELSHPIFEGPVGLVLGDVTGPSSSALNRSPIESKFMLWNQSIVAWRTLEEGGTFICRVSDSMNRFTVGVLYLLHRTFRELSIIKPGTVPAWTSDRIVVCRGKLANDPEFLAFVCSITSQLRDFQARAAPDTDVLEIVPISYLLSGQFAAYLTETNDGLCQRQAEALQRIKELDESDRLHRHQQLIGELGLNLN
eukprot:GILJ01010964.1.p1 GENE.GILJ01010964.1~~GILJ01010964.1.p1  ORF type:complete len:891 (-),score=113.49 GILJ01010964.1:131-2803(-)